MDQAVADAVAHAVEESNAWMMLLVGVFGTVWCIDKVLYYLSKWRERVARLSRAGSGNGSADLVNEFKSVATLHRLIVDTDKHVLESMQMQKEYLHSIVQIMREAEDIDRAVQELSKEMRQEFRDLEKHITQMELNRREG